MTAHEGGTQVAQRSAALIVSANPQMRDELGRSLGANEWSAMQAEGGAEALELLENFECSSLFLDRWLPDLDVNEVVEIIRRRHPRVHITVMDAANQVVPLAVEDLSVEVAEPQRSKAAFLARQSSEGGQDYQEHHSCLADEEPLPGMIGSSEPMQRLYRLARLVAPRATPVLIGGETGTGKELVARAIHALSRRSPERLIALNRTATLNRGSPQRNSVIARFR